MGGSRRIAVAVAEDRGLDSPVSATFGRCRGYALVATSGADLLEARFVANPYADGAHPHGVLPAFVRGLGAQVVVAGEVGARAAAMFADYGIEVVTGATGTARRAALAYLDGALQAAGRASPERAGADAGAHAGADAGAHAPPAPTAEREPGRVELRPIGVIRTAYGRQKGTPIQASMSQDEVGSVELYPQFREGLADLDGFSHAWLIYLFDRACAPGLRVRPYLDTEERGVFATRAPGRPNRIGLTAVRVLGVENGAVRFAGVDMLDGTPVLDIKPYVPAFDQQPGERTGWYARSARGTASRTDADDRFATGPELARRRRG